MNWPPNNICRQFETTINRQTHETYLPRAIGCYQKQKAMQVYIACSPSKCSGVQPILRERSYAYCSHKNQIFVFSVFYSHTLMLVSISLCVAMLRNISTGSETRVMHAICDVRQKLALFKTRLGVRTHSGLRACQLEAVQHRGPYYYIFICSLVVVPVGSFTILIIGGSTLNFCNSRNITIYLCICDQHSVRTHFFVIHFIVHCNQLRHYIQSCEPDNCVFNINLCLYSFSSVTCSSLIFVHFITSNWYVLSLFNYYITCEKSDFNLCNSITTQW